MLHPPASLLLAPSLFAIASAFIVCPNNQLPVDRRLKYFCQSRSPDPTRHDHYHHGSAPTCTSSLGALIYGWDDGKSEEKTSNVLTEFDSSLDDYCPPSGVEFAEMLSYDEDRVALLARLAVAFSPPERTLSLDQIERVDVICVRENSIEIQAIICEDGGCVSLAVPVSFPESCSASPLEGCVISNLERLDESAQSMLLVDSSERKVPDEWSSSSPPSEYPLWWVYPTGDTMVSECASIRSILNEKEFQPEIVALAQSALQMSSGDYRYSDALVDRAVVTDLGPSGLCFRVLVSDGPVLEVGYHFQGQPMADVESLRAGILGIVATA